MEGVERKSLWDVVADCLQVSVTERFVHDSVMKYFIDKTMYQASRIPKRMIFTNPVMMEFLEDLERDEWRLAVEIAPSLKRYVEPHVISTANPKNDFFHESFKEDKAVKKFDPIPIFWYEERNG